MILVTPIPRPQLRIASAPSPLRLLSTSGSPGGRPATTSRRFGRGVGRLGGRDARPAGMGGPWCSLSASASVRPEDDRCLPRHAPHRRLSNSKVVGRRQPALPRRAGARFHHDRSERTWDESTGHGQKRLDRRRLHRRVECRGLRPGRRAGVAQQRRGHHPAPGGPGQAGPTRQPPRGVALDGERHGIALDPAWHGADRGH